MGCCRGKRKVRSNQSADCKALEDGGAGTTVQVLSTQQGPKLVIATKTNGFMDLGSFVGAYKCSGATAKLIYRYLDTIQRALQQDPSAFQGYRSGISLANLLRVAEQVTKRSQPDVKTQSQVPSNARGF